jgi:hypothetical protein
VEESKCRFSSQGHFSSLQLWHFWFALIYSILSQICDQPARRNLILRSRFSRFICSLLWPDESLASNGTRNLVLPHPFNPWRSIGCDNHSFHHPSNNSTSALGHSKSWRSIFSALLELCGINDYPHRSSPPSGNCELSMVHLAARILVHCHLPSNYSACIPAFRKFPTAATFLLNIHNPTCNKFISNHCGQNIRAPREPD